MKECSCCWLFNEANVYLYTPKMVYFLWYINAKFRGERMFLLPVYEWPQIYIQIYYMTNEHKFEGKKHEIESLSTENIKWKTHSPPQILNSILAFKYRCGIPVAVTREKLVTGHTSTHLSSIQWLPLLTQCYVKKYTTHELTNSQVHVAGRKLRGKGGRWLKDKGKNNTVHANTYIHTHAPRTCLKRVTPADMHITWPSGCVLVVKVNKN